MSRPLRSTIILAAVAVCAVLAAVGGWRFARASAPVNGPIILVSVDALRADRLGAFGNQSARTPAIDSLAADGVTFERAYAHVPQTLPAHAAILTGRLPFETGVRDAAGPALPASVRTLAEMLRDRGYATAGVVSSWLLRTGTGVERGFTFFDLTLAEAADADPVTALLRDGADAEQVAERWLDALTGTRAFLFLHIAEPHAPHAPPERFSDLAPYDGEVAYADEVVGRLLRYLKAHQLYDRSTVVLVGDHGESLGEHGESTHGLLATDGVLRVPLIVKLPGNQRAATRTAVPAQHIDLVPTILDLAKAPRAAGLRGRSLTPIFEGGQIEATSIYAESTFAAERFGWPDISVLIEGSLKLVVDGSRQSLFDLSAGTDEAHDLSIERPAVVSGMRQRLAALLTRSAPSGSVRTAITPADQERLDALGYVALEDAGASQPGGDRPDDGVAWMEALRRAAALSAGRDWRGAARAYRELARSRPESAELWRRAALAAARADRYEQAVEAYTRAIALAPDHVRARLEAAAVLLRARRIEAAREHLLAVAALPGVSASEAAETHELQARAALLERDYDTARLEAARAEEADPDRPVRAFIEGRIALLQGRPAEAAVAFETALAAAERGRRPPLGDLRVLAAEALTRLDRTTEAEALLESELRVFPDSARARAGLQAIGRSSRDPAVAQH